MADSSPASPSLHAPEGYTMKDLSMRPENKVCADCDMIDPDWTSINLGIFLCIKCAGVHRNLGVHHSKVRSIDLDTTCWDPEQIDFMFRMGNVRAQELFEYNAPQFYVRPTETENPIVRENWIRAKYVRKEFTKACEDDEKDNHNPAVFMMPERAREGYLHKCNPRGKWQKRWFLLHGRRLRWFNNPSEAASKNDLDVSKITVTVPAKPDPQKRFSFEVKTAEKEYVMAAESVDDMFAWVHALRRAQVYYSKLHQGVDTDAEKVVDKTTPFKRIGAAVKKGELSKVGGKFQTWSKRRVYLADGHLYYFTDVPTANDTPEGGVYLENVSVAPAGEKIKKDHCFSVITSARQYFFCAISVQDMKDWIGAIQDEADKLSHHQKVDFRALK